MSDLEGVRDQYDMIRWLFWGFGHSTRHNLWEGGSERAHKGGSVVRYSPFCTESCSAAIWIGSVNQDKSASANGAALRTRWKWTENYGSLDEGKAANFNPGGRAIRRISRLRLRLCRFSWPRKPKSHTLLAYCLGHRGNVGLDELACQALRWQYCGSQEL
jgi:hypothetical protein